MTERSYFWASGVGGDASYSPYNAEEFNNYHFLPAGGEDTDTAYVVPAYLDDLTPVSTGVTSHSITIKSGAAILNNYLYVNDSAITIPITRPTTGYQRRDIVILRFSQADSKPKIRVAVLEGAEVVYPGVLTFDNPQEPTLTQTALTYEVALAGIYVNSVNSYVLEAYIDDRRKFLPTEHTKHIYGGFVGNLVRNSEFLHFSGEGVDNHAPDEWYVVSSLGNTPRVGTTGVTGRDWYFYSETLLGTAGTIAQFIRCAGRTFTVWGKLYETFSDDECTIILRGYRKNGQESSTSKTVTFIHNYPTSTTGTSVWTKEVQFTHTFPEDDIVLLQLSYYGNGNYFGKPTLVPGYYPTPQRAVQEIILSEYAVTDASWTATAKSTGTTTINLTASFSAKIKNHTKAVILRLRGRDSGSAGAASCAMNVQGYAAPFTALYGHLEISGVTNDVWRETYAIVPVDQIYFGTGTAGAQFRVNIVASGVGTFDATLEVVGVIV